MPEIPESYPSLRALVAAATDPPWVQSSIAEGHIEHEGRGVLNAMGYSTNRANVRPENIANARLAALAVNELPALVAALVDCSEAWAACFRVGARFGGEFLDAMLDEIEAAGVRKGSGSAARAALSRLEDAAGEVGGG